MDSDEIRSFLSRSRADIWSLIDTAIGVAGTDYGDELRRRRDKIVESLYAHPLPEQVCRSCNGGIDDDEDGVVHGHSPYVPENIKHEDDIVSSQDYDKKCKNEYDNGYRNSNEDFVSKSPLTPESNHRNQSAGEEEEELDTFAALFDDEQTTILSIKEQLEDPNQSEDAVVELLQNLADMDITFHALKETDIGRHVNRLRKHSSNDVRILVKQLVRKWKEAVDDWVKVNQVQGSSDLIADGDSPQQTIPKNQQNGHHQGSDIGYSPNPRGGRSSVERKYPEYDIKPKAPQSATRREAPPSRPPKSVPKPASAPPNRGQRESSATDDERLNSARKRLQENYQEAQNAKKNRTVQMMDIHEIPKPKNTFFSKNKGGFQGRHHR